MKKITLNNIEYQVPENWCEVTLKHQIQVSRDTDAIQVEALKKFAILSGYANIGIDVIKKAKLSDLQVLFSSLEFINTELPNKPLTEFEFNGSKYYVGQNLTDMQFQDFVSIENTIAEHPDSAYNALPTIIAIMAKRIKADGQFETLDDYDVLARAKEFEDLPISIANQISLFFSLSEKIYGSLIPSFLERGTQRAVVQKQLNEIRITAKLLAGKGLFMRCVSGILLYCLKYTTRKLDKHYTSTQ